MPPAEPSPPDFPSVPLLDLSRQYATLETEILTAIERVCRTQRFILGESVKLLEERVADYCQCRFGIGMSSGSDALLAALMALGVGPGDEVITTPYTFFSTAGAIVRLGARPVFSDIEADTFNLSVEATRAVIDKEFHRQGGVLRNRRTGGQLKVLLPVHLFGQLSSMVPILELARELDLRVVEDAAQAIGAEDDQGQRSGSYADIGCFSFFPTKNLGAFGDGGMCTTSDPDLAEKLRVLRNHGAKPKFHHSLVGGNFRLDELQAAVLLVKLEYLDPWTEARQHVAATYEELFDGSRLAGRVQPPKILGGFRHVFHQYVIRTDRRDDLQRFLRHCGVETAIYYPLPLHVQRCFEHLGYRAEDLPASMAAAKESLALPMFPELTRAEQIRVVEKIGEFVHSGP